MIGPNLSNALCPCGSGKKFRECCKSLTGLGEKLNQELQLKKQRFIAEHGYINPPIGTVFQGKVVIALEGSIYVQTEVGPYNFVNALHDHALHFFGTPLLENEEEKALEDRLVPLQWLYTFIDRDRNWRERGMAGSMPEIGAGAAWIRFAYDLYTIRDSSKIVKRVKQRLLSHHDFQGARHELAVSALFIAAGFDLDYEDDTDNSKTHTEFVAKDRFSPLQVCVEAKKSAPAWSKRFFSGATGCIGRQGRCPGTCPRCIQASKATADVCVC